MGRAGRSAGLVLLDAEERSPVAAPWAGPLLALGARLARWSPAAGWQMVVAVTLPARDYAALLIGAGWVLTQPRGTSGPDLLALLPGLPQGTPVRMAAAGQVVVANRFYELQRSARGNRINVGGTFRTLDKVTHLVPDPALDPSRFGRVKIPRPGSLARRAGREEVWARDWCTGAATVAMIGTRTRLERELDTGVGWADETGSCDRLRALLRPDGGASPVWASTILAGGNGDLPEVPPEASLVVLDGSTAVRWLAELTTTMVVALVDRSSVDESAHELIAQLRAAGRTVVLERLGWHPAPGMEALAFEVRL